MKPKLSEFKKKILFYCCCSLLFIGVLCIMLFSELPTGSPIRVEVLTKEPDISFRDSLSPEPTVSEIEEEIRQTLLLNINSANKKELVALVSIGEVTAEKILSFRNENGDFLSIDELFSNELLTEKQFETIKNEITV